MVRFSTLRSNISHTHSILLCDIVEAARKESFVGVVGVRGLVVGRHLSVVVLGVLHEVVRVHPAVEHEHVVAGQQQRVSLLHLAAADARANLLQVAGGVAAARGAGPAAGDAAARRYRDLCPSSDKVQKRAGIRRCEHRVGDRRS